MKMLARLAAAILLVSFAIPAAAEPIAPGTRAAHEVRLYIEANDCAAAAARLQYALAKDYPQVHLLAGVMYEAGICVKADWNRAVDFYSQAYSGGQKAAMYRLMAGFAAPEHGPDIAAALWWANRPNDEFRVNHCRVDDAYRDDPDRFVEELRRWPQPRLAMCNYMVGVLASLGGEIRYPEKARMLHLGGSVKLRFMPAVRRIDLKTGASKEYQMFGWINGNAVEDRQSRSVKGTFEAVMREVANRALKRYPQPAGIPSDTVSGIEFVFELE